MRRLAGRLLPSRHLQKFAVRAAALVSLLALGACSEALGACRQDGSAVLATQDFQAHLPNGCTLNRSRPDGFAAITCSDGREGFLVVPPEGN